MEGLKRINLNKEWTLMDESLEYRFENITLPCQIHDALLEAGKIENPNITGINYDGWIGERKWIYKKRFTVCDIDSIYNIKIQGIDIFADIFLNDVMIGRNESVYMPLYLKDIPIKEYNELEVRVYSPREILKNIELPEEYGDKIPEFCKARVFRSGMHEFSGPKPDLIRMGIYGNVILEKEGKAAIQEAALSVTLNSQLNQGSLHLDFQYGGLEAERFLVYKIFDMEGKLILEGKKENDTESLDILVENPKLWFPRTHGEQNLYEIEVKVYVGTECQDIYKKTVGFRRVEQRGEFNFYINGLPVKLWGGNLAHADTLTGCYPKIKGKLHQLLDLAEMANFNCLRVWGESEILDDDFYEECDRRGMLLWQDFYLGFNMYSEESNMLCLYRQEAEILVQRLKYHPSLLLWCGGNEMYWSRDMQYPGEYCIGEKIFEEIYPEVCRRLDPGRYYHSSSPSGGEFSNDPRGGDTHGYTHIWFVPGRNYPLFLSENCRVSAPELKTMEKMMKPEELWPENYCNIITKENPLCWPMTWNDHNTNDGAVKVGSIEHYFDAESPQELIYRLGEAHCEYIKQQVEQFRRGRPSWDIMGKRRTHGHILWKFNNNSNIISYGVVDYFNEPLRAYYALKRAYEPFQISFSVEDSIGVWVVNDTPVKQEGSVQISLLELDTNKIIRTKEIRYTCIPDESMYLGNLDDFGQFKKNIVLIAQAFNLEGVLVAFNLDYVEIERRLRFPKEGKLDVIVERREEQVELVMNCDTFARSVELIGDCQGDNFGWIFQDNYFDLIPGIEKRIKITGKHKHGIITVKPYYWKKEVGVTIP